MMWYWKALTRIGLPSGHHRFLPGRRQLSTDQAGSISASPRTTRVHSSLGKLLSYPRGWAWQHILLQQRLDCRRLSNTHDDEDLVLLLEHEPVYTLGRGADESHLTFLEHDEEARTRLARSNRGTDSARLTIDRRVPLDEIVEHACDRVCPVLAPNGVPIYRVERGGEVTYHGPGQLVVYPMLDLTRTPYQQDLHWFLRQVEDVVIRTLAHYDIEGHRDDINTGVWVGERKVCAVGVSASRWITTHGFALNVAPELDYFDTSVLLPCGVEGRGVTSISELLKDRGELEAPSVDNVAQRVLECLRDVFELDELDYGDDLH